MMGQGFAANNINNQRVKERVVLFVDDEPYVLEAIKRSLANLGFKIITASSPLEALKIIKEHKLHVVVADYNMPQMLGHELLEKVHEIQPNAVRVVLTGVSEMKVIQGFIRRGKAYRFLLKPWDTSELKRTLQECFDLSTDGM